MRSLIENGADVSDAPAGFVQSIMAERSYPPVRPAPQVQAETLGVLWELTELVLSKSTKQERLVHAAASVRHCPLYVVQLAVRLHPGQLLERDDNGNTPLILAIEGKWSGDVVNTVLEANPRAATSLDAQGRSPLALAVATGQYSYQYTLSRLFSAEPNAATTRDALTALFPFALAAIDTTTANTAQDDNSQLSTIYALLRVDPSLLTQQ
jgi:hypothetical protein